MIVPGLKIDADSSVPVYRQIADAVLTAYHAGHLDSGHRLPPTRDLARRLGVNRQTVVAAYDYLAAEGRVSSHPGKGTFLVASGGTEPGAGSTSDRNADEPWQPGFSRAVDHREVGGLLSFYRAANVEKGISFAGSYPARDRLPDEPFRRAVDATLRDRAEEVLMYGPTSGFGPLRELLAKGMRAAGSPVEPDDLLITNGAQQAIDLIFHTFLERGDTVVIEEPTYTGALSVLGSIGARVVSVPVDDEGIRPDLLAIELERHRPRLVYVQPSFQNPTTAVMGVERRREILDLASRSRALLVEDDWAAGLRFEGREMPTLHALDRGERVLYLSTFSKKLLPGLRIGWIAAPRAIMQRLITLKQIRDCGTSPLLQAALHAFLEAGGLEDHLKRSLPRNRERRDRMIGALEREFPAEASWTRPGGGLFVWVTLPRGLDSRELASAAEREGVRFSSGNLFHRKADALRTLRLTYSTATPEQIDRGVAVLGRLIQERISSHAAPEPRKASDAMPIL